MIKDTLRRLKDRVRSTRSTVADVAEAVGAPGTVSEMIRPEERLDPGKPDPWANPVSVQSADDSPPESPVSSAHSVSPLAGGGPGKTAVSAEGPAAAVANDPIPSSNSDDSVEQRKNNVQLLLDEMVNPAIASHGGHITLIELQGDNIHVEMGGGCQGCGAASLTLKAGVERMMKEELPWLGEVIDVTDHSMGDNPYYAMEK